MADSKVKVSYVNEPIVISNYKKAKAQKIIGGILTGFFAFGVCAVIAGQIEVKHLPLYIVCLLPSAYLLWCGIRTGGLVSRVQKYNEVIAKDRDGIVTPEELGKAVGKPPIKAIEEVDKMFRKGYFHNCSLQNGRNPGVVIDEALDGEKGIGFVDAVCKNCGATAHVRAGGRIKCPSCGGIVYGKYKE
ncbi:MAG: hypothetical protein J5476_12520 [Lachnospiraceae bacterium]|nr:hypothetical protein [Lachnospiraceae bacterium]